MIDRSELVADALRRTFPAGPPRGEAGDWSNPALDVLDCVLSLNRNYDHFCQPRVTEFRDRHPEITSVRGLRGLIGSYPTPLVFSIAELNYRDERRAATLVGVAEYLIKAQTAFSGATEAERLLQWAMSVKPSDYLTAGVSGFGLSGFQYLRILLGGQTVKPDIYIRRFVSSALGREVGDVEALALLEAAGQRLGWPLADLDYAIWDGLSRGIQGGLKGLKAVNRMNSKAANQYTVRCNGEVVLENAKWAAAEHAARALMVAKERSRSGISVVGTYVGGDKNYSDYVGREVDWMTVKASLGISTPSEPTVELLQHALSLLQGKAPLTELYNDAFKHLQKGTLPPARYIPKIRIAKVGHRLMRIKGDSLVSGSEDSGPA